MNITNKEKLVQKHMKSMPSQKLMILLKKLEMEECLFLQTMKIGKMRRPYNSCTNGYARGNKFYGYLWARFNMLIFN